MRILLFSLIIAGAVLAFLLSVWVLYSPENQPRILITEVLASNRDIIADEDGEYNDFIELYNAGKVSVNLRGWYLSDGDNRPLRWMIPQMMLHPGEYVVFFASGKNRQQTDGIWHTNFSISTDGSEPVILTMPDGTMHHRVAPFVSLPNISYGLMDDFETYAYMSIPTPGESNIGPFFPTLEDVALSPEKLIITEYMTRNDSFFPDEEGFFHDWVEIYNPGDVEVHLRGWYLSDNMSNPRKWKFPADVYVLPGGFLVLHCSGLYLPGHVPFKLSETDEFLTLSDHNGFLVDRIRLVDTPLFASFGRTEDGSEGFFSVPSPGQKNIGTPDISLNELSWDKPTILIMEYMSNNNFVYPDEDGDFNDWVEIYNFGNKEVDLSDIWLSDSATNLDKWNFPDGTRLLVGQRIVTQLSGKPLPDHGSFRIGVSDDGIFLSDRFGRLLDSVEIVRPPSHVSIGRDENDHETWLFFPRPTPGEPNDTVGFTDLAGLTTAGLGGLYISQASMEDWVDITNASADPVSMSGWSLTNTSEDLRLEPLPDDTLTAGETYRVFLTNFRINGRGEVLTLIDDTGIPGDVFATGTLRSGVTAGRAGPFSTERVLLSSGEQYSGYALPVIADTDDLIVSAGTVVTLRTDDPAGVIRYTLDGAPPTESSRMYTTPITVNTNTILRACVFTPGKLSGTVLTRTYLVDVEHSLPIVTLASEPAGLHSHSSGILAKGPGWQPVFPQFGANFHKRWERETHFAFYEDGQLRVEADAGLRVHGSTSKILPQKSLTVLFRAKYGISKLAYPLVPHVDRTLYDALVLRSGGQDLIFAKLRDTFISNVVLDVTNVIAAGGYPVVVYLNGEYWGFFNLREKINEDWIEIYHGIPNDELDLIKYDYRVLAGSSMGYREMMRTLSSMNMNTDAAYDYADSIIDLDNWIDYWILVTYFGNSDTGNILRFKQHGEGHKWRWVLYDQDFAMKYPYTINCFSDIMLHPHGHGTGRYFSTAIARALMKNDRIKDRFIERYAELMQTVLSPDRLIPLLDAHVALIESEMPAQVARWGMPSSVARWENEVEIIRNFLTVRGDVVKGFLRSSFHLSDERMDELFPKDGAP